MNKEIASIKSIKDERTVLAGSSIFAINTCKIARRPFKLLTCELVSKLVKNIYSLRQVIFTLLCWIRLKRCYNVFGCLWRFPYFIAYCILRWTNFHIDFHFLIFKISKNVLFLHWTVEFCWMIYVLKLVSRLFCQRSTAIQWHITYWDQRKRSWIQNGGNRQSWRVLRTK